ncbi:MAG: hypothetical protein PWQ59_541 [Thermoanaerobacterium sp.]|nr:hypothetical protein [Thermoanaerobacterium sp.]MDN5317881.1 hypothetical protein [Thermoanaerobacterium sp.]
MYKILIIEDDKALWDNIKKPFQIGAMIQSL